MKKIYVVFGWDESHAFDTINFKGNRLRYVGHTFTCLTLEEAKLRAWRFLKESTGRTAEIWSMPRSTFRTVQGWDRTTFQNHEASRKLFSVSYDAGFTRIDFIGGAK